MTNQKLVYSEKLNIVFTEINDVFHNADKILGWSYDSFGIGFNLSIIKKCLETKADLVVEIKKGILIGNWIIKNSVLFDVIETVNTEYTVKSHYLLKVIPAIFFKAYEVI